MIITRGFSLTNFVIGTSALSFQIFVLYPWHHRLDQDFQELKEERLRDEKARILELKEIKDCLAEIRSNKSRWF